MNLHAAEGFLYTKHPVLRPARPVVTHDPMNDDGERFGYAYTARRFPRPTPVARPRAWGWTLVFGYAYTARYQRIYDTQVHDERVAA